MDTDYFLVCAECGHWTVSAAMARAIEAQLGAWVTPRWISFVDLHGARVRIRTRLLYSVSQCYAETRAAERAFRRRIDAEDDME